MLLAFNTQCDVAENGLEAQKFTTHNVYNLIFLDLGLPDIHGLEVLRSIKGSVKNDKAYIVVLTGHAEGEYKTKAFELGVDEYVLKPVSFEDIKQVLKRSSGMECFLAEQDT